MCLGTYNKPLSTIVYLESRCFLPLSSSLRSDKTNFPCKPKENCPKPSPRTFDEVKSTHEAYNNAENKFHYQTLKFCITNGNVNIYTIHAD